MRAIDATVGSKGQVTIPSEVRRKLGLPEGGRVTFLIEDERVELRPARLTLESVFGSVESLPNQSADFDREIEEAMEDHADEVVARAALPIAGRLMGPRRLGTQGFNPGLTRRIPFGVGDDPSETSALTRQ